MGRIDQFGSIRPARGEGRRRPVIGSNGTLLNYAKEEIPVETWNKSRAAIDGPAFVVLWPAVEVE